MMTHVLLLLIILLKRRFIFKITLILRRDIGQNICSVVGRKI